ncbi:synaptic vesicle glycoprotein 2C-like isoform X1 [Centruroides vittatus]|uniref:synaptic vesicle glycoprotein 2C-like isoform X1 n=1 Tax=Centruroides vittatus TaxID=120091 RepID=UPI00350EB3B6
MPQPGDESENVSLVSREALPVGSYTEESGRSGREEDRDDVKETDFVDTDVSLLSQFHQDALTQAGYGVFQWMVFVVAGLGLAADSIEVFVVAYVIPSAERELCMEEYHKGWLGGVTFLGMMIGGLIWGNLADKLGRRRTLLSALSTNAVFSVITAFMPTYGLFVVTRLCSGIGIGGSLPIVFTYYSEFLQKKHRGRHLSWLLIFWAIGGVFVAVMAWGIVPKTGLTLMNSRRLHFGSWRVFLLICSVPSVVSLIGMVFLPESPRYLLEAGRDVEAMYVYQKIFKMNHINKPGAEYQCASLPIQLSEMELPARRQSGSIMGPSNRGLINELCAALESFWTSFVRIFLPPHTTLTVVLLVVWSTTSFGFYGLQMWFPEYTRKLEEDIYNTKSVRETNLTFHNITFNYTLENKHFLYSKFQDVKFSGMLLNHCTFVSCLFYNCSFSDVRSSRTYFRQSTFRNVVFVDTDFYDYKLQDCQFENSALYSTKAGCTIDFDVNYKLSRIFLENLIAQLAIIPGNIISSCILDKLGRVKTIGMSLFLSSFSIFFLWLATSQMSVVAFQAIFNFVSISGWNAIDVITTEAYPVSLRSTGYGFSSAIGRLAAVLGSVTFGSTIESSRALPILITATVLLVGCICSVKLPETKELLM